MLDNIQLQKKELRLYYSNKRKQIFGKDKALKDRLIFQKLRSLDYVQNAENFFVYLPLKYEVSTFEFIKWAIKSNKNVVAPVCDKVGSGMNFYSFDSLDNLKNGRFGISEPQVVRKNLTIPGNNDVCLLPGLAFDKSGHRLGYGKGFYDRYLKGLNPIRIGLCYNACLCDTLPYDGFDVATNTVVTEEIIIKM